MKHFKMDSEGPRHIHHCDDCEVIYGLGEINSALCPFCKDGIGHAMDAEHAAKATELIRACMKAYEVITRDCEGRHENPAAIILYNAIRSTGERL